MYGLFLFLEPEAGYDAKADQAASRGEGSKANWQFGYLWMIPLRKFNIAPENLPSQKERQTSSNHHFSGAMPSFRGGIHLDQILFKCGYLNVHIYDMIYVYTLML